MDYEERKAARKRGEQYLYGGLKGGCLLVINAITILAVILLIASCLFEV